MRLLHTSDWHLGRSFHGVDLLNAQVTFLDHLVDVVRSESVDAVLVSGDVYDRALPSADAVALCDDGLSRLAGTGAQLIVISGNHDSATRLGWGSRLLSRSGVHIRCDRSPRGRPRAADRLVRRGRGLRGALSGAACGARGVAGA